MCRRCLSSVLVIAILLIMYIAAPITAKASGVSYEKMTIDSSCLNGNAIWGDG